MALCALEQCGPQDSVWPDCLAGCGHDPQGREAAVYCLLDSPLCDQLLAACEPIGGEECHPEDFGCEGDLVVGCDPVNGGESVADCPERCAELGYEAGTCMESDAGDLGLVEVSGTMWTCRCG